MAFLRGGMACFWRTLGYTNVFISWTPFCSSLRTLWDFKNAVMLSVLSSEPLWIIYFFCFSCFANYVVFNIFILI